LAGRGRLIAIEGGEGFGKSTVAAALAADLGALVSREPGGTALGERIRGLLLGPGTETIAPRAEALLMAAARAEHVAEVLEPALASGRWVVTDRFSASSLAYQGYGRGLSIDDLKWISGWAAAGLWPDLNVLIDVPEEVAVARREGPADRLESESQEFHRRVVAGFMEMARGDPHRWVVIDGVGAPHEVAERALGAVLERVGRPDG
jgi:dTMP kinase